MSSVDFTKVTEAGKDLKLLSQAAHVANQNVQMSQLTFAQLVLSNPAPTGEENPFDVFRRGNSDQFLSIQISA